MKHDFGEKAEEYSVKRGANVPVWQSPKYKVSRDKAVEVIESGKYGLQDGDFWILMNETKTGKMAYTGLITSHNACLKINDALAERFKPSCVTLDKEGYAGSLVYTYCCEEQGIYEVGEVNGSNCKNAYPYAMAYKRLFDRVVLKLSKLAYAGVYSEAEADEFRQPEPAEKKAVSTGARKKPDPMEKDIVSAETQLVNHDMINAFMKEIDRTGCTLYPDFDPACMTCAEWQKSMQDLKQLPDKAS